MPYGKTFEQAWIGSFKNAQIRSAWTAGHRSKSKRVKEHLQYVIAIESDLDDADIDKLFELGEACIEDAAERQRIAESIVRAGIEENKLKAEAAHTATYLVNGEHIVVMLDNDQLKHQPREHPIGTRRAEGTKFPAQKASPSWHEDNTMKVMAAWAANTQLVVGGKVAFKQGDKYLLNCGLAVSFEGNYLNINHKKYVLFHCYPNDRQQVQAKAIPWDLIAVVKQ